MEKEYILLFNAITKAIEALEELRDYLIQAQQMAAEIYISK